MAKRVVTILASDLSDQESDDVETVSFGWAGADLEIDLTAEEREDFERAIQPYLDSARRKTSGKRMAGSRKPSGSGLTPEQLAECRAWLQAKGEKVADRGRIAGDLIAKWEAEGRPRSLGSDSV